MRKIYFLIFLSFSFFLSAQEEDSAALISEVKIDAYKKPTSYISSTKSASVISPNLLKLNTAERLLESINQIAGSRMEERSPGSYRIAVRGSSLRSPFGVRNVKVYLDDFILSDASGNTYFNVISPELINRIEIYKGPEHETLKIYLPTFRSEVMARSTKVWIFRSSLVNIFFSFSRITIKPILTATSRRYKAKKFF